MIVSNQKRKKAKGGCLTPYCRNRAAPQRKFCHKCNKRAYRQRHPDRYAYENLRRSAQLRDIPFLLTFEEFTDFVAKTEYDPEKRGCSEGCCTVDRIDPSRGYEVGNIRPMEFLENSRCPHIQATAEEEIWW